MDLRLRTILWGIAKLSLVLILAFTTPPPPGKVVIMLEMNLFMVWYGLVWFVMVWHGLA